MDIVVLVSGRGSNLKAICHAIDAGTCGANIVGVVSDRKKAAALDFVDARGIPSRVVPLRKGDDRDLWNDSLAETVTSLNPNLVVLAGFMRVLGAPLLERFPGRIINVHPALLPAFPGHNGPQDALDGGVRVSGCTVHIVDVLVSDSADSLHARIQVQEHRLLPAVIHQIAIGAITLDPFTVTTPVADPSRSLTVPDA